MQLPKLTDIGDVQGKRVLVRVDFNVPVKEGVLSDTFRIEQALPTINYLLERGAKVILMSHLGRDPQESLAPVFEYLKEKIPVSFVSQVIGKEAQDAVGNLEAGKAILLENLRREAGENDNDPAFAKTLASYGDLYVNEAFPVSHRESASMVGVPKLLPHYAGFQFVKEVEGLSMAFSPAQPALFLLGGAKFETKSPLITKFLKTYDTVFVGGALANDFFKARGDEVGRSLVSDNTADIDALLTAENLLLPGDVVVEGVGGKRDTHDARSVAADETILDIGPDTVKTIEERIIESKFVLWNGTFGAYEKGFAEATEAVAKFLAYSGVPSVVGGGDTVASIGKLDIAEKFTFLSTAGGAMLDFLATGTLPGIDALH